MTLFETEVAGPDLQPLKPEINRSAARSSRCEPLDSYEIMLRSLEQIGDVEELARTLHEWGLLPNGDSRLEALFRRALRGNGFHSQFLAAAYGEPA